MFKKILKISLLSAAAVCAVLGFVIVALAAYTSADYGEYSFEL